MDQLFVMGLLAAESVVPMKGGFEVKRFGLYEAVGRELTGERVLPPCVLSD